MEHYFHTHYSQSPFLLVFEQCDLNIFYQFMKKKSQLTLFLTFSGIVSFGLDFKQQKSTEQFPYTKHKIMEDVCTYSIGFGRKQLPRQSPEDG